ncbi:hypothetical protein FO440_05890 [Mucilaginibacter corticis]|uniref:Uncharacterized protein n=1 Tax=Mucilaginibacter corticis TaxID=2597670 RepID=A0A556MUV6_9SPHI|nr:hypothetical protein [Mucilaginibacter corticis]TSJ43720.1 hypothetical protein FO440_05890 [Mucilaginibacter corticis]
MAPDEETPVNEEKEDDFPEITTNDHGQATTISPGDYPELDTNDVGQKYLIEELPPESFPEIDTNDRGDESEE